jgi:hypothetical protein
VLLNAYLDGVGSVARFNRPVAAALHADGTLYVADRANFRVRKFFTGNLSVITHAGDGTQGFTDGWPGSLSNTEGIAVDGASVVYISDAGSHSVRKVTADGVISTIAGTGALGFATSDAYTASFNAPYQLAVTSDGHLYVADTGNKAVRVVSPAGYVSVFMTFAEGPRGIALDATRSKLAVTFDAHCVRRFVVRSATDTLTASASRTPAPTRSLTSTATPAETKTQSLAATKSASTSRTPAASSTGSADGTASLPGTRSATVVPPTTMAPTTASPPSTTALPATAPPATAPPSTPPPSGSSPAPTTTLAASPPTVIAVSAAGTGTRYAATITVTVAGNASATDVAAVAFADHTHFAVATHAATWCANATSNRSVACRATAAVAAGAALSFDVVVGAPAYYTRPIAVVAHVACANAAHRQVALILTVRSVAETTAAPVPAVGEETVSSQQALRAVFSLDGGCTTPKAPFVLLTVACFVVVLVLHWAHQLCTRDECDDAIKTLDVLGFHALVRCHSWSSAVTPCHRRCGPTHSALLLVHVLCIEAVLAGVLSAYGDLAADPTVVVIFALFAGLAAAALRPVVGVAFDQYSLRDERHRYSHRPRSGPSMNYASFHVRQPPAVGQSRATLRGLPEVEFDDVAADGGEKRFGRNLAEGVTVEAAACARVGFVVCAGTSVALALAAFFVTAPWCGARVRQYEQALIVGVAADIVIVQPLYVLGVWLWRWMVSEEADGRALHNLHPINGQWRVVGRLFGESDDEDDDGLAHDDGDADMYAVFACMQAPNRGRGDEMSISDI